jgi:hypothetical protein
MQISGSLAKSKVRKDRCREIIVSVDIDVHGAERGVYRANRRQ